MTKIHFSMFNNNNKINSVIELHGQKYDLYQELQ